MLEIKLLLRRMAREPHFQIVAVVCLALGLSVNALMLGVADSFLFHRPPGVQNSNLLKRLYSTRWVEGNGFITSIATSYPNYADLRLALSTDAALTAYFAGDLIVSTGALDARKNHVEFVADSYFDILGIKPLWGRLLLPSEVTPSSPTKVALTSASLASAAFGGPVNALGKNLRVGSEVYIIVGVLPRAFRGLDAVPVDLWLPINAVAQLFPGPILQSRDSGFLKMVCRLGPSVSIQHAEERATAAFRQGLAQDGTRDSRAHVTIAPIQRDRGPNKTQEALVVFWIAGVAFLVLVLACVNVAQLLMARSLSLGRDLVVQLSLGAGRIRLLCLVLAQSSILTLLGGMAAGLIYFLGQKIVRTWFLPPGVILGSSSILRSFAEQVGLVLICSLLCGSIPSLLWWRNSTSAVPHAILGGSLIEARSRLNLRRALLGGQVALASVLLIGAGLFVRSLYNLRDAKLGLDAGRVLVVTPDLASLNHSKSGIANLYQEILTGVRQLPGIESASLGSSAPLVSSTAISLEVPGVAPLPRLSTGGPYVTAISEDFFKTLGAPLRSGRTFTREDLQQKVAIVNETMSHLLWPGQSALGKCIRTKGQESCWIVVGVVADIRRSSLREDPTMQYYLPLPQAPDPLGASVLLVRPRGRPASILRSLRDQVRSIVPDRPFVEIKALQDILNPQFQPWLLGTTAFSILGVLAFFLATVGVYSLFALTIEEERRALALRMALGALPLVVLGELLKRNLLIVAAGIASSLVVVFIAGGLIRPFLFGVSVWNPEIVFGVAMALFLVSSGAVWFSGRRIQKIEPAATLRSAPSQIF